MDIVQKQDVATLTESTKVAKRMAAKNKEDQGDKKKDKEGAGDHKKVPLKKLELKKKLQEVSDQNECLSKAINEKNLEIAELHRSVQSLNEVLNSVPIDELRSNSSIASTKILDLSKKNRQLTAELETTKNRLRKKEMQLQKLENELKVAEEKFADDVDLLHKGNTMPITEMQTKLNSMQQKLFESRNKNIALQNQLKLAQKCLHQEIGENFNLNTLASQGEKSQWRGRAQQIIHLQQKIQELKERLEQCDPQLASDVHRLPNFIKTDLSRLSGGEIRSAKNTDKKSFSELPTSKTNISFDRFIPNVRKNEITHRAKVDALEGEIKSLKEQLEDQRHKVLALKVRNKTLNEEVLMLKGRASTLQQQTSFDGMNLASVNEKLNIQKGQYESRIAELRHQLDAAIRHREEAEQNEAQMRSRLENIEDVLDAKEAYINELDTTIKNLETDMKAICGDFLFSCRELRKEEFIAILDALEAEKTQLVEHTKSLTDRLAQEHTKNIAQADQISKQKIRICRLETRCRDLEKELEAQGERKRRSQRIADYATNVSKASVNSGVSSFVFENTNLSGIAPNTAMTEAQLKLQNKIDDLKNQLEVANEKITLLQEKHKHLSEEKEHDVKAFEDIIANSKTLILESILGLRRGDSIPHNTGEKRIGIDDQSKEGSNFSSPTPSFCTTP